jgi:hypothetical protein
MGERGDKGVEIVLARVAHDPDLGGADLVEEGAELERALVDAAVGAEEEAADEDRSVREEDGDVVVGALAVVVDEGDRLFDLPLHRLVVDRVQRRELHQAEERGDDGGGEVARVDAPGHLAGVLGEDVEAALLRAAGVGAGRAGRRAGEDRPRTGAG